jgi:large conductance mechanosensitive channel
MLKEFREFAMKGNVLDMAIGVIMGGAFGKIVSTLVGDVLMPPIGLLMGNVDFSDLAFVLKPKEGEAEAVTMKYGLFLNTVIDFLIVAFVIFMVVKQINRIKKQEAAAPAPPPEPSKEEVLLTQIRDILKARS